MSSGGWPSRGLSGWGHPGDPLDVTPRCGIRAIHCQLWVPHTANCYVHTEQACTPITFQQGDVRMMIGAFCNGYRNAQMSE